MASLVIFRQQVAGHGSDQRTRQQVRREHREYHRKGEWREQETSYAGQENHGEEDDADAKRADQGRRRDLARAVQNCHQQGFVHRLVAVDVFDFHGCVVDQHPNGERDPAKRHRVDGLAGQLEPDDRSEYRKRNRGYDDQHRARRAQENQHHQRYQHRRRHRFLDDVLERCAHELGLIEGQLDLHTLRRHGFDVGNSLLDPVDDCQRRCVRMLDYHQIGRGLAVDPNHVCLRLMCVAHGGDLA